MNNFLQHLAQTLHIHDSRIAAAIVLGVLAMLALILVLLFWRRPSAAEIERRRREVLSSAGRITDGLVVDARTLTGEDSFEESPEVLLYSYRLAGVTYNCAQDVSTLPDRVVGFRIDQPIQVRYDPRNPGNSIVVSEAWSGLWQRQWTAQDS